jgi:HAD superfamily hydrolase (TIGR01509 family)
MPTPPSLVCFDLGGVFIRLQPDLASACRDAGVEFRGGWEHLASDAPRLALIERYQVGAIGCGDYYRAMSDLSSGRYTPAEIEAIHRVWVIEPYAGIDALLDELDDAGIATACLSNTNASHWRWLEGVAAFNRLPHRHASHLLGFHKPDERIYQAFERQVGRPAGEILLFDDLPENVAAARQLGWHAHQIDPQGDTAAQMRRLLLAAGAAT